MITSLFHRRFHLALPLLAALLFAGSVARAEYQPRNDTGQTRCFNMEGKEIDCTDQEFPGQDAAVGRDLAASAGDLPKIGGGIGGFDFTKIANDGSELPASAPLGSGPEEWACTRDNHTGFIWEVKTEDAGPRDKQWVHTWYNPEPGNGGDPGMESHPQPLCGFTLPCNTQAYIDHVNSVQLCGLSDWRMPTRDEAVTIVHYGSPDNYALDDDYFVRDIPVIWTIDTSLEHEDAHQALSIVLLDGHVESAPKGGGHVTPMLVSGAPFHSEGEEPMCGKRENPEVFPNTAGAFEFDGEGLVRDTRTELVWDRCAVGQELVGDGEKIQCEGKGQPMSWHEALQRVRELNKQKHRGHDDWRLPNIKELQSIIERRCLMPVLDTRIFPNVYPEPVWSSTTAQWMDRHDEAWVLQMEMGHMMYLPKHDHMRVRLVRGGADLDDYQGPSNYRIGGTLDGMVGTGLVLRLQAGDAGEDSLVVNANGGFNFAMGLPDATSYEVTVLQAPVPEQSCTVVNGSGTVGGAHVGDVQVTCAAPPPAVIEVTPDNLAFEVQPGQPAQGSLAISNLGGGILHWEIDTAYAAGRAIPFGAPVDCSAVGDLIVHDDGMHETGYGGQANWRNGLVFVERFVPSSYPASIRALCLPLTAQGATSAQFEIIAFRDNGPDGAPGTELGSIQASASGIPSYPVATPQWFAFDLGALYTTIDSGGLYLGMRGLDTTTNVFILTDESDDRPVGYGEGYWRRNGIWERMADMPSMPNYRATLMRAAPGEAQELPVGCSDPNTVPWLSLDRYAGQTNAGDTSEVAVHINSNGMAPGEYHALLCIASDGSADLVQVPVALTVTSQHTVTPSAGDHGSIDPSTPQTVESGGTLSFTITADAGWHIAEVGGSCGGELTGSVFTTLPVTADCTVEASFKADPIVFHTVTPSAGAHGSIDPSTPQTVESGETLSFTITADAGWHIAEVGGSCGGELAGSVFTTAPVTADCTVEASFKADPVVTHTVTPSAGPHGAISPSTPQQVAHGQSLNLRIAADAGWKVASVGGTCGGEFDGLEYITLAVTGDCTVEVDFEADGDRIFADGFDS